MNISFTGYLGPIKQTEEGHDITLVTNYLSHFLLTKLILKRAMEHESDKVVKVINVISDSAKTTHMDIDIFKNPDSKYGIYK